LVTESANDAAVVLAEGIGGSTERFAHIMTQQARALGMKRTLYRNPNGLPDHEQVTTAFDQAILARAMLYHFPQYYKFFRTRTFTYDGVAHRNHNRLMTRYEGMDGIKTGYIRASGFNLIASARRGGKRLIAIVFGGRTAKSRDNRVADILDYGFDRIFAEAKSGKAVASLPSATMTTTADVADVSTGAEAITGYANKVAEGDENTALMATEATPRVNNQRKNNKSAWAVHVGTFKNRTQGLSAISNARHHARKHLKHASANVIPAKTGSGMIYRARLGGLNEKSARQVCASLTHAGQTCLTVPPRG
jgi:D-alanyl-D-alanine carboxypeptidase